MKLAMDASPWVPWYHGRRIYDMDLLPPKPTTLQSILPMEMQAYNGDIPLLKYTRKLTLNTMHVFEEDGYVKMFHLIHHHLIVKIGYCGRSTVSLKFESSSVDKDQSKITTPTLGQK
jgi:hypothetical protein